MGILYNRFTPESFLLPYSDQTKMVTYATGDNFDASSSTWGTGTAPVVKNSGSWSKANDGSVTFSNSFKEIDNVDPIRQGFTIYEVLRVGGSISPDINFNNIQVYKGEQSIGYVNDYLFRPAYTSSYGNYYRCSVSSSLLEPIGSLSAFNNYHITVAALEYLPDIDRISTYLRCNDAVITSNVTYVRHDRIQYVALAGSYNGTRYYKFIAVVAEKESNTVIANNVAALKNYYSVVY